MASIYDFAPASLDSVKDTDFSTNYGFNVVTYTVGMPQKENFIRGIEAYANIEKDAEMRDFAHTTFGKNLPSKEHAPFWVGQAYINQMGYKSIADAYIDLNIPIPENAKDFDTLTTTLGRNILDSYRKQYDERAAIAKQKAEKAQRHYKSFFLGTLDPGALDPQELKDFTTLTGFSPSDVIAGGKVHRASQNSGIFDKLEAFLASQIKYAFFNSDYNDTAKEFRQYADARWDEAWGNKQEKYARIIQLAENPSKAIQVAAQAAAEQKRANIKDSNLVTRTSEHIAETANELAEGTAGLAHYLGRATGIGTDTTVDHRQGERVIAALDEAKETETAQYNEQNGITGLLEGITRGVVDIAPFANIYTAIPSMVDMFTKNAGRSYSAIANESGYISDSSSNAQVYSKAAVDAGINYGTRALGMKYLPKVINRGLTKWGVNSTLGHYISTSLVTGGNFAVAVPAMDASLRAAYDAVAVKDPRLKNGVDSLKQWWSKDLPSLRYWMTQAGIGAVMGASGTFAYHRSGQFLALKAEMSGLTKQEADSMRRTTPLEDLSDAYQKVIKEKLDTNPQQAIDTAIANTRQAISDEEARLAEENGHRARIDAAKQATLRFYGITIADGKDADHVNFLMGGSIDPMSGKYIVGSKTVELNAKDADLWLGSLFQARAASRTKAIKDAFGVKTFLDAALSHLKHQVKHEAVLDPLSFNQVIKDGSKAEAKIKKLTKSILDKSKGQDGKPTLTEAQARAQAEQTKQGNSTLKEIVNFAKEAQKRMEQEQATNLSNDPDASFLSNVYVISKGSYEDGTLERVFRIAYGASTREMVEDYAEQWMKDYIFEQRMDYTDLWRELHSLNQHIKGEGISATTLQNRMPQLAQRLLDEKQPLTSDTIDNADEAREIRRDIIEGMSNLHLANLAKLAQDGKLPAAFQPLLDSKLHSDLLMEQDMALAAALDLGRSIGKFKEAAARLFDASAAQIQSVMDSVATPTVDTYYDTYVARQLEYKALMDNPMGLTAELVEATLAKHAKDAEQLAKQIKAEDEERNADAIKAVKDAEADPANAGKSHEQIVEEVNTKIVEQKEFEIADNPVAQDDTSAANGKSIETVDEGHLPCRLAIVDISTLSLMPNFKTGSDKDTGEVEELTGDYHPDHDPIRVMQRTDGSLMVFSGRHRLAHAKRHNAAKIAAYIYQENAEHNLAWARLKDIEWNIKDNQATPQDVALLIRGELIDGIPALTEADCVRMGITRKGSQALIGYNIGKNATPELINAWRNDPKTFTNNITQTIALFAPNDPLIQKAGIKAAADGIAAKNLPVIMGIEQDRINYLINQGIGIQLDLFNEADFDSVYNDFVNKYALDKVNLLNRQVDAIKTANKIAKDENFADVAKGTGLHIDNALRKRNQALKNKGTTPQEQLLLWRNPWTNMDIIGEEINTAFAKTHPEEWQRMQERKAALETPIAEDSPDLGNTVQGDVSNVKEFEFDASITSRERIEQNRDDFRNDPSFGLGQLGTFESIMLGKFKPTYDDLMDARLATMIKAVERRMRELGHVYDKNQSEKFMAEMQALITQLTTMLPKGFSFGLEAYQSIIATYAALRKTGDPDAAAAAHPVEKWQEIMAKAFRNQFDRLLSGKLSKKDEEAIANRFPDGLATLNLSEVKKDLNKTRREYYAEVDKQFNEDERSGIEYRQARAEAREHAYQDVKARHQAAFEDAYQKLAAIRADKLMGKFLDRVYLKLNQYRKQRIVNKIYRALYSITPTKVKNGKPVKGTVEMSTYNTIRDNFRLLNLTKAQKDAFEADHPELADAEPESTIDVPTYDEEGNPITLKVTKQQYDTYASMETMSADTLNETAKALGTLIAQGKEAWQLKAEAQRAEIENFCAPIYDLYAESNDEKAKRLRKGKVSAMSGNSRLSRLNKILPSLLNDADLIDTISSVPGLQQFKKVQDRIAEAHIYMETSEAQMKRDMTMAALNAIGINVESPLDLTAEQTEALINFCNDKVAVIKLDKPLVFSVQPPDFEQQQRDIFRVRFLKHMQFVKDKKNFNPDELAYALQIVKDNIPADIFEEAMTRFGNEGDSGAYKGDTDTALNNVFPIDKFGQLRNLNKSIKDTAEAKLAKWQEQLKESKIAKSFELTEITREEAAYKVLMTEQPDLAETLHQQGYTDEVVKQLKAIAGKEMMAYAYTLREHLNARLPMLQQVYEATYGTPFPAVTNYFRAFFDTSSQEKNAASSGNDLFTAGNLDSKSMRLFYTRFKHNKPLHPTMTVSEAFAVAYKQQSNILAYSDKTTGLHLGEMLNKVMANKRGNVTMQDTLANAITSDFRDALQDQIANMYRIYGESEASEATASRLMSDLSTSQAFGILAWRMASLFKNGMAFFNTLGGSEKSSIRDWFKSMHTAFTNTGAITAKEMMQDPLIRDRFKGWDLETYGEALLQAADVKTAQGKKILGIDWNKFSKRGLAAFGSLDRWFTNRSAVVQYNATYSRLKKDNPALPESILREEARNAVKEALGVKGQPMDFRQRPLATTKNRWLLAPYFFLGGEAYSTVGNLARLFVKTEFTHLIDRKDPERAKQARRNLATLASVWMVNGFAYSLMNLGVAFLLDDEETWRKRNIWTSLGLGTLLGPIAGMPIISNLANEIIKEASGSYWLATPSYLPMQDIVRTYREFMDIFDEDSSTWDVIIGAGNTARNIAALALLGFLRPVSKAKAATKTTLMASAAVLNIFDTAARAARAADERLITPVPEKPQKGVKMSKQSRELNKALRKHNADDLLNFTS